MGGPLNAYSVRKNVRFIICRHVNVTISIFNPYASDEGDFVGKGPAVSVGDMLHEPDDVPPSVPEPAPDSIVSVRSLLLHEPTSGVTAAKPRAAMIPFFKKAFLSIRSVLNENL